MLKSRTPERRIVGRVAHDTKGPPGIFLESGGLWNGRPLID